MLLARVVVLNVWVFVFSMPFVQASSIDDELEWRLRDRAAQEAFNETLELSSKPVQLPEVEVLSDLPDEEICFVIDVIDIEGLLSDWAKKQGQNYIGQCVGFKSIQSYVRLINQKLLADGYITSRAFLPEQNLSEGTLEVIIQKGIIEEIRYPEGYRFYSSLAIPLTVGNVLNLRDMEQAVDQLNRLQSHDVEFKVQPGLNVNTSVLVAEVTQTKPWQITLSVDDSGSDSTGNYPLTLSATIDNIIGVQDSFKYATTWARAEDAGESNSSSVAWSLPLGYWLMTYTGSQSDYLQDTEGTVTDFELSGNSNDHSLALAYVAARDNKSKTTFTGTVKTRERRSYLDDAEIEVQARDLTELKLGGSYRRYIDNAVLDVSLNVHQGVSWFGAEEIDDGASSGTAQPDYRFYSLSASLSHPFTLLLKNMNYVGQVYAQYADTTLYSLDWFSNGGRYTVRGFSSDDSVSEESGWRFKNDISLPFAIQGRSVTTYFGVDIGQVYGDTEEESGNTLMGVALGLKGQFFDLDYDAFIAAPFLAYGPYADSRTYNVNVTLSAQF